MLTMCILRRCTGKQLSRKKAMFMAAFISAIPAIIGMTAKEQSLFKLLIYPLMYRCLFTKIFEIGLLPTLKRHGDILGYFIVTFFFGYCQLCESYSN